jgi:competence protein ComEC
MNWWLLKRKVHISWLIAIWCIGIFIGIFIAKYNIFLFASSIILLIISLIIISIVFWRKYIYLIPLLIIGGIIFGLWRGSISQNELSQFNSLYGKAILIEGSVKDDIDIGSANQIVIRLDNIKMNKKSLPGVLWVTSSDEDIKRGDILIVSGTLLKGFGNFSGVIYRAKIEKIIHPQPGDVARVFRDWFAGSVRLAIPEPESSLGIGYLVGQRRALPPDLLTALQLAGLTHIIVASGYNLTILVRLARRLFAKISKYLAALSATMMIVFFIAITGMSPSMSRAGLVAGLSLAAWYYGRKFHPIILLSIAIAVTVIINPSYAWGDLGWQLSFAAFAGVMILAPLLQRYLFGNKKPGFIGQVLGETVSAQIATAPIIIAAFGQLSNVAIISNLLVLPLVPIAMLLTFIAGIGSIFFPFIAEFIGLPATWLLHYMVTVTEYLASLPWVTSTVNLSWWGVAICYVVIICICLYMWRVTKYNLRDINLVE